jgi:hypothetical protein
MTGRNCGRWRSISQAKGLGRLSRGDPGVPIWLGNQNGSRFVAVPKTESIRTLICLREKPVLALPGRQDEFVELECAAQLRQEKVGLRGYRIAGREP